MDLRTPTGSMLAGPHKARPTYVGRLLVACVKRTLHTSGIGRTLLGPPLLAGPYKARPTYVGRTLLGPPLLAGMILAAWITTDAQVRTVDEGALKNAGRSGNEWLTYGLTPAETRY